MSARSPMIGLDTNVLLRYLTKDDPEQSRRASEIVRSAADRSEQLYLNIVVLCEAVWVLESSYGYGRQRISEVLDQVLRTEQFEVEGPDAVRAALARYRDGEADFSDYLISRTNTGSGCDHTVTFDAALRDDPSTRVL